MRVIVKQNGKSLCFNSDEQPITIVLDAFDKERISTMMPNESRYTSFPEGSDIGEIREWVFKHKEVNP